MALVLSLSLDLFLMKGNFIAVRVQPETDKVERVTEQAQGRWSKGKQKKKKGKTEGCG